MARRAYAGDTEAWVELPTGIFTADGIWYHTTEAALREFAGPVVDRVGVSALLSDAGSWFRGADAIAAVALALFLLVVPPLPAAMLSILLFLFWDAYSPDFVLIPLVRLFRVLSHAALQAVLFVLVVSWLGAGDELAAALVGLAGFILFRWGLVRRVLTPVSEKLASPKNRLPKQDRILRALVLRHAIAMRVTISATEDFEHRIMEIWQRGKRK